MTDLRETQQAPRSSTRLVDRAGRSTATAARSGAPQQRPTWAEVDVDAIAGNVAALKAHAAAPRLLAVVKADGYGHGLENAALAAVAGGADWLGVALVEEGLALRAAGIEAPVLVLTEPLPEAIPTLVAARLTPAVYTAAFTHALDSYARRLPAPVRVHLKLDTGMRRVGVPPADWEDALRRLRDAQGLALEGLWSHFAVADEPEHPFIAQQGAEFQRAVELARGLGLRPTLLHLANSAGTLHLPEHHYDMVRPGLAIYGLEPAPGLARGLGLVPALSWYARLTLVKRLAAGEPVSYGLRWSSAREALVGTVPAGYADGVRRGLSNVGEVLVDGRRVPIVGTVCMDQFLVDLADVEAGAGAEVVLLGGQGDARVTADDWAGWLGTINYEIVCGIGQRVPRVRVGGV